MKNKLLLYVHFNRNNELSEHVIYQIQKLRQNFEEIFFISNSKIDDEDLIQLTAPKLIDGFMQRENAGYDFAAWSGAMKQYGFDKLSKYDSVTIMNDTCFGPIYDLTTAFEQMDSDDQIDFWGITNNRSHKVKPWEDKDAIILPDHIQSYFVSYKQNVVKSVAFEKFWSNIEVLNDVVEVIIKYETAMTKYFENAGFKSSVLFDTRKEDWTGMVVHDFSVFNLPELLKRKIPFLKIKAFSYGAEYPTTPLVMEYLKQESDYPLDAIVSHMTEVDYPDREYMLAEKTLKISLQNDRSSNLNVAIHLHATQVDIIQEYLNYFDTYVQKYDLYLTTDSESKKQAILEHYSHERIRKVVFAQSDETGILAWMKISSLIENYPICGHFYTEQSLGKDWLIKEVERKSSEESLLKPAQKIFYEFEKNSSLGLVTSEIKPTVTNFESPTSSESEVTNGQIIDQIWQKIDFKSLRNLGKKHSYMLTCDIMVWYRPQALQNFLSLESGDKVFQDNITKVFGTLLIYISWANGYDFKVLRFTNRIGNVFRHLNSSMLSNEKLDPSQIRARELVRLLFQKMKKILKYRLMRKE